MINLEALKAAQAAAKAATDALEAKQQVLSSGFNTLRSQVESLKANIAAQTSAGNGIDEVALQAEIDQLVSDANGVVTTLEAIAQDEQTLLDQPAV